MADTATAIMKTTMTATTTITTNTRAGATFHLMNNARTAVIRHVAVGTHHKRRGTVGIKVEHRFVLHTHQRRAFDRLQFCNVSYMYETMQRW